MCKMKRSLAVACALLSIVTSADGETIDEVLETIREKAEKVTAFRADYVETVLDEAFPEMPDSKSGGIAVKKSKEGGHVLVHISQKEPYVQHIYLTPAKAVKYDPGNKIAHVVTLDPKEERNGPSRSMDLLTSPDKLRQRYSLTLKGTAEVGGKPCWEIVLVPVSPDVETDFSTMTLWVDQEIGLPRKAQGLEHDGSVRTFELSNVKINPRIRDAEFEFKAPAGVDVEPVDNIRF